MTTPPPPADPQAPAGRVSPLRWQRPADVTDYDVEGRHDALFVAAGWAGVYAIDTDRAGFILWWAHDGFLFQDGFASVEEAQAAAEQDWQARIGALIVPCTPATASVATTPLSGVRVIGSDMMPKGTLMVSMADFHAMKAAFGATP